MNTQYTNLEVSQAGGMLHLQYDDLWIKLLNLERRREANKKTAFVHLHIYLFTKIKMWKNPMNSAPLSIYESTAKFS